MRRALIPLAITLMLASVACSGDESETTDDPRPAAAEEQQIASTEATVAEETEPPNTETTVADESDAPGEALALTKGLGVEDGTLYDEPEIIAGPAALNLRAEALTIDENQLQYHYTLQPGLNTTIVYTQDGIWPCRTGEADISLIDVASE